MNQTKSRIIELRNLIQKYDYHYYVMAEPIATDYEYDQVYKELIELEQQNPEFIDTNSPTQRVGSDLTKSFPEIEHSVPMLSLSNTYNPDELEAFDARIKKELTSDEIAKLRYVAELKIDGISVSLKYVNGSLSYAATRGDGFHGEEITNNVKTIKSIPLIIFNENDESDIPKEFEVRGEIFMDVAGFNRLNEIRKKNNEPLFKNPRNSTAGTVKLQDPKIVASRPLDIYLYYLLSKETEFVNHSDNLNYLKKLGFKTNPNNKICNSINEVLEYCNIWEDKRNELPYEIDGVVVKVDNIELQNKIGSIAKSPRWAVAFKFKAEQKITKIK
jgi:DNA ligase (NAD+)